MLLGYGFWEITRNVWIALAIGALYPASLYLGVMRSGSAAGLKELLRHRDEMSLDSCDD